MVRKSDRNKTSAAAVEKPARKRRGTRRRKDSSSESEPEANPVVREENVSAISLPKDAPEEVDEVESSSSGTSRLRNRRVSKRNATAKDEVVTQPADVPINTEWNEDASFWAGGGPTAAASVEVANEEEGSTWKIQSSNGSGGEIQKLKICRQRPTDSTGSSSPAKECASPRIKKMAAAEKTEGDDNTEVETETPMDIVDVESEKTVIEDEATTSAVALTEVALPPEPEVTEPEVSAAMEVAEPEISEEIIIPGLDLVGEGQQKQDQLWMSTPDAMIEVSMIEMPPSKEEEVEESNIDLSKPKDTIEELPVQKEEPVEVEVNKETSEISIPVSEISTVDEVVVEKTDAAEITVPDKDVVVEVEVQQQQQQQDEEKCTTTVAVVEEEVEVAAEEEEETKDDNVDCSNEADDNIPTATTSSKCLSGNNRLSVSSELAMEQIAKKLNERAARGKESLDDKDKSIKSTVSRENSPDIDRSIEEGEIVSSAAATPDPQPAKSSKTTVVIKPKVLAPDAKPVDKLGLPTESDGEAEAESEEIKPAQSSISETSEKPIITDRFIDKHDDVEVTVSNDVREVKKKKPIVIDTKSPPRKVSKPSSVTSSVTSQGPKLPTQENHKATRKISIVSADAKALRKSPSPSRKKPTEVLFITNLVRPFTVPQLRELLARTGTIAQNGFYIDKIKSKCYVKYTDVEMAIETRHALHGVRWPVNNPKTLRVDFALPEDMAVVQKLADEEVASASKKIETEQSSAISGPGIVGASAGGGWLNEQAALKPSRRVTATVREWDMGKVLGEDSSGVVPKISPPSVDSKRKAVEEEWNRKKEKSSRSEKERDRRRVHSPDHKAEPVKKMKKKDADAPAKLLDDLFRKTKATPCIYWLPLTAAQIAVKEEMRRQHMAEHERRLAELRKSDVGSRRDNKDRPRDRDRRKK